MSASDSPPRLAFARDFPRDPELDILVDTFARGNYAIVELAPVPSSLDTTRPSAQAARSLLARTAPDRSVVALMGLTVILLVVVSAYWIAHGHP